MRAAGTAGLRAAAMNLGAAEWLKLGICLLVDFIGAFGSLLPFVGEAADAAWAPISAVIIYLLFHSQAWAMAGFWEEFLPFTDIVPTATLAWAANNALFVADVVVGQLLGADHPLGELLRQMGGGGKPRRRAGGATVEEVDPPAAGAGAGAGREPEPDAGPDEKPDTSLFRDAMRRMRQRQGGVDDDEGAGRRVMGFDLTSARDGQVIELNEMPLDGPGVGPRRRRRR